MTNDQNINGTARNKWNGIHIHEDFIDEVYELPFEDIGIIFCRLFESKSEFETGRGISAEMSKESEYLYKLMLKQKARIDKAVEKKRQAALKGHENRRNQP
jgi:hypothetical protein